MEASCDSFSMSFQTILLLNTLTTHSIPLYFPWYTVAKEPTPTTCCFQEIPLTLQSPKWVAHQLIQEDSAEIRLSHSPTHGRKRHFPDVSPNHSCIVSQCAVVQITYVLHIPPAGYMAVQYTHLTTLGTLKLKLHHINVE